MSQTHHNSSPRTWRLDLSCALTSCQQSLSWKALSPGPCLPPHSLAEVTFPPGPPGSHGAWMTKPLPPLWGAGADSVAAVLGCVQGIKLGTKPIAPRKLLHAPLLAMGPSCRVRGREQLSDGHIDGALSPQQSKRASISPSEADKPLHPTPSAQAPGCGGHVRLSKSLPMGAPSSLPAWHSS